MNDLIDNKVELYSKSKKKKTILIFLEQFCEHLTPLFQFSHNWIVVLITGLTFLLYKILGSLLIE